MLNINHKCFLAFPTVGGTENYFSNFFRISLPDYYREEIIRSSMNINKDTKAYSSKYYVCLDCGADTWDNGHKVFDNWGEEYTLCLKCWEKRKFISETVIRRRKR